LFYMRREGVDRAPFSSHISLSGNHEQSVISLLNGGDAIARFEDRYWARHREKVLTAGLGTAMFAFAFAASTILGEIDLAQFAAGVPNVRDDVYRTVPEISARQPINDIGALKGRALRA
jgi:hypothetical protein